MISNLQLENYKSFERANFEFPNLTFFVGPNSCGKSSVSNSLLMLTQSLDSSFNFETVLRLNGKNVGLGDEINIVRNHDKSKKVVIAWSVEDDKKAFFELTTDRILDDFYHNFFSNHAHLRSVLKKNDKSTVLEKSNALQPEADRAYYGGYEGMQPSELVKVLKQQQSLLNKFFKSASLTQKQKDSFYRFTPARLSDLLKFIKNRDYSEMSPKSINLQFRYNNNTNEIELEEHSILNENGKEVLGFHFSTGKSINIRSEIIPQDLLNKSRFDIASKIHRNSILLTKCRHSYRDVSTSQNPFAAYCLSYLQGATEKLCEQLTREKIYHVSPLRALPQRYYLLEKSANHKKINSYSGTEVIEVLKNNPKVLKQVNEFFSDFNISILTVKVRDVIHKLTIKQDGLTVDLKDVGFGISQVLPILVQLFLCEEGSTVIIEQPEIHLHPNMQAILTSLLVKISLVQNKKLIIETHSEAMIRRLQLLYLDPKFELNNSNVRFYQFTRNDDGTSEAHVDTFGLFGEIKWIKGFKDIEIQDTLRIQELRVAKATRKTEGQIDE